MSDPVTYQCPAKVNLALSVGAPRDDGFHPIASWMVKFNLFDDLIVQSLDAGPSEFAVDWADDALSPSPIDWPVTSDLIYKAHQLMQDQVGRALPVRVRLMKRIPVGAGLGGGSGDGAGMLDLLNSMFELNLPIQTLSRLAAELGSDVPFFLEGSSSLAFGRGEILEPAALVEPIHLLLILPNLSCPTGPVYRTFDALAPEAEVQEQRVRDLAASRLTFDGPFNDLAEPACTVEPRLAEVRQACAEAADRTVHVTGSGAAMFIVGTDGADVTELQRRLGSVPHIHLVPVTSVG